MIGLVLDNKPYLKKEFMILVFKTNIKNIKQANLVTKAINRNSKIDY